MTRGHCQMTRSKFFTDFNRFDILMRLRSLKYLSCRIVVHSLGKAGFHPVGEVGGKLPPQNTQLPPQKEREKEEKRKRRERERERERERGREREVHGGGRGACIFLHRMASDQYIVSYFMTQLFKSTR